MNMYSSFECLNYVHYLTNRPCLGLIAFDCLNI